MKHTAVGASATNTRGSSAGWDFYKLKKTPSPTCVYVLPGRGKWNKKLTTVPHAENPDFTLAQCTELCTKDAKCTQAAYQYTTRVLEGEAANTNICITYVARVHARHRALPCQRARAVLSKCVAPRARPPLLWPHGKTCQGP